MRVVFFYLSFDLMSLQNTYKWHVAKPSPIMSKKMIVFYGRDHLLGRLASAIAKEQLSIQKVIIVRCDEVVSFNLLCHCYGSRHLRKLFKNGKHVGFIPSCSLSCFGLCHTEALLKITTNLFTFQRIIQVHQLVVMASMS